MFWLSSINLKPGPELQCLLIVKEDLSIDISTCYILNAKLIDRIGALLVVKDIFMSYRKKETILFLLSLKRYFVILNNQY